MYEINNQIEAGSLQTTSAVTGATEQTECEGNVNEIQTQHSPESVNT